MATALIDANYEVDGVAAAHSPWRHSRSAADSPASSLSKPIPQNRLMLHRVEFGDFAETHHLRFTERLISQELIQFIARFRTGYQDSSAGRDRWPRQQEPAFIVALLQKLTMRGYELGGALFEGNKVLSLQEKVFHLLPPFTRSIVAGRIRCYEPVRYMSSGSSPSRTEPMSEPISGHSSRAPKATARARGEKPAGERVFEVAADLFYRESIRAVGVETIVKQAGVAKISLYRSFESKDDLIVAYLEGRNADYWRNVDRIMATKQGDPRAQLRALMSYVAGRATTPGYRGCPFINYASEFPDASHPGHRIVEANKQEMRQRLVSLTEAAGAVRPKQLADALFLLIEGAYASSQTLGGRNGPAATLASAADALIECHLSS